MRVWTRASLSVLASAIVIATLATHAQTPASSQRKWAQPRTAWGDPDLQGIWNYATMTPLERPRELADKDVLTQEEAAEYERQTFERQDTTTANTAGPDWWERERLTNRRTSLIVDPPNGRVPPLTPEAQKRATELAQARRKRGPANSLEDLGLSLSVRCVQWSTAGPPMLPVMYNNNVQFVQTHQYVAILNEMIHDARIVPMDGRPHGKIRQWMGDSRGHWEGNALVVDTVNFSEKTSFRGSDGHLHLIERFTRTGPDTIEYQFTVEDQTIWTRSWTAAFPLRATEGPIYEYACHEGNARSVEGILSGARTPDNTP